MDTKTSGLPWNVVQETINQARKARLTVLKTITDCIPAPRSEMSKYAPRIESFRIHPDKIRDVIGPGGKMINEIIATHKVEIDIEDDGLVMVTSVDQESMRKAVEWIKQLTREVQVGEVFEGPVVRIMAFGAFVQILPKVDGLVHISEMALNRVEKVEDVVKIGDMVKVVVTEIDGQGRINLSMKRLDPGYTPSERDNKPLRRDKGPRPGGKRF
jgi:polyribonucleotide nucleotidyltransferase